MSATSAARRRAGDDEMSSNPLADARHRRGCSLRDVAGETGIAWSRIRVMEQSERPNPRLTTARALARFYGVPIDELFPAAPEIGGES
jgi:transcriptional regulator with XRE-family HTH domain